MKGNSRTKGCEMKIRLVKNVALFIIGVLVGMWFAYTMPQIPTIESCEQYLEQVAC